MKWFFSNSYFLKLCLLGALASLCSCNYQRIKGLPQAAKTGSGEDTHDDGRVRWAFHECLADTFIPYCARCHGPGGKQEPLYEYSQIRQYVVPGDPDGSWLYERMVKGEMPNDGTRVPEKELEAVKQWILNGANND